VKETVLVIEDEPEMQSLIRTWLGRAGYEVLLAADGLQGLRHLYSSRPGLVLLDVMLPRLDGWEICRRIREACETPVIMVTAKNTRPDVIKGFDLGADDYITKPFDFPELLARIRSVLRRTGGTQKEETPVFKWSGLEVDFRTHRVSLEGKPVSLSPTEFRLLACLVRNLNRVVSHEQLLLSAWGPAYVNEKEYIKLYVRYLRKKLERDPEAPRFILTERGMGYRFAVDSVSAAAE